MGHAKDFNGKVALISGAGSGIGLELAKEFGRHGAIVVGTDIRQDRVVEMKQILAGLGIVAHGYCVDHAQREQVERLRATIQTEVGHVDILCANAGIGHGGRIGAIPHAEWQWVIDVNLWGAIHMVNLFLPAMIERQRGWVLITSSGAALCPSAGMAPYNVGKFAKLGLAQTMYMELKSQGIKVSALCPGIIATKIIRDGKIHGQQNTRHALDIYAEGSRQSVPASVVARDAVAGLAAGKPVIRTPLKHILLGDLLMRVSRKLFLDIGAALFKRGRNYIGPLVGND